MGAWNAFYVKADGSIATLTERIRSMFSANDIEASSKFVGVRMPDDAFEVPEDKLSELSHTLNTEVIWLGFQSTVDAFQYHHWKDGKHLRALVYGCFREERVWERVEGMAEGWEKDVFFEDRKLVRAQKYASTEAEKKELDRIWRESDIRSGQNEPSVNSKDCAHKVAAFYEFPHYG